MRFRVIEAKEAPGRFYLEVIPPTIHLPEFGTRLIGPFVDIQSALACRPSIEGIVRDVLTAKGAQ